MIRHLGISVEKLLVLDILKGARVLSGASGLAKRITKVNVMEVPDIIEWVSEGEFLITTAYSIKDNIRILLELIPTLKEKGVVGLGIKLGRFVPELPAEVLELSDRLGFPIIEVPFCTSHTEVISAILTEVINDQMNMLLKLEAFNREVMNIMIKGGGLKEIAMKLYDNIGNSLAIYENMNDRYELICGDNLDKSTIDNIIHSHAGLKKNEESVGTDGTYKVSMDDFNGCCFERITIPIVIEKIEYGCIFIWLDNKTLTPLDNVFIESYVHIIALEFVKKLAIYNLESNYQLDFFDDLLSDNEFRQNRAIEKAKTFNFHKELKYSVIVILLKELGAVVNLTYKKANYAKEYISSILFVLNRIVRLHHENVVFVEKSDRIIILFGSGISKDAHAVKKEATAFCEKIFMELPEKFDSNHIVMGIGRGYDDFRQLWKSHEQAKLIVEKLSKDSNSGIIHYDDLGLYRILSFDGLQSELAEFYSDTIRPLVEYDKVNNSELVKTLKYYYRYNGNMKKISEKMYLHYNTIIYRLQKIKDITGLDIENCESRLNLEIALKIMDLVQI